MNLQTIKTSFCYTVLFKNGSCTLKERGSGATLTDISLSNIPPDSLIIKFDKTKFNNLLKNDLGWGFNKHSDYIIITHSKILFVEMKSKKFIDEKTEKECIQKFASDLCTISYLDHIFENLLEKNSFFKDKEKHFVLLYQAPPFLKTETIPSSYPENKEPKNFRKIAVHNNDMVDFHKFV